MGVGGGKRGRGGVTLTLSPRVAAVLERGGPVVALESTIVCHGIPRPENAELARDLEEAVRQEGAVPATTAVIGGAARVGLTDDELAALAADPDVVKCTTRDLPRVVAAGVPGATTVASTLFLAARVGISVMATGGIGGVHRGGEASLDVSADLEEMARSPAVVVASGIKAFLDLGRTMERLETLGVPVVGFGSDQLAGFYTDETGIAVPRVEAPAEVARQYLVQRGLGLPGALLVAVPPPADLALPARELEPMIADARSAAAARGVAGPAETPFILRHLADASGGRTVTLNRSLAVANARLAARIAVAITDQHRTA